LAVLNGCREQDAVAHVALVIEDSRVELDPGKAIVQPDSRREQILSERMLHLKLGEYRAADECSGLIAEIAAEARFTRSRNSQRPSHNHILETIQILVELPEIPVVRLLGNNITCAGKSLPIAVLDRQPGQCAGLRVDL